MIIGGFVSSSGGVHAALTRAAENQFDCAMFFIGSPNSWHLPKLTDTESELFKQTQKQTKIIRTYAHGLYLANLATPDNVLWEKSVQALITTMNNGYKINLTGVIFHLGSHKQTSTESGIERVIKGMQKILSETSGSTKLIMENSVKQGDKVGVDFNQLGQILKELDQSRVAICYDTCHGFASGYNYVDPKSLDQLVLDIKTNVGTENVTCVHTNDSLGELNNHKDRHANIGQGYISKAGFKAFCTNPVFNNLDFILEVPGIEGNGPSIKDKQALLDCIN